MSHFPEQNGAPSETSPISMLPDAVLDSVFSFVGNGQYRYVVGTNHRFRRVYQGNRDRTNETFWTAAATSVSCAELVLEDYKLLEKEEEQVQNALSFIFSKAIVLGNVGVLEWAWQKGVEARCYHFEQLGKSGHIAVLEWFDSINIDWYYFHLFCSAAVAGHVHVFEWIFSSNGIHRDALLKEYDMTNTWRYAGKGGQLAVLEWIVDNNLKPTNWVYIWDSACEGGRVNVLDWLVKNGYEMANDTTIVVEGARYGHLPVMEWALDHGDILTTFACTIAAARGHLNALQWLRENGCPWDGNVVSWAERAGRDHVVEWARANGCPEQNLVKKLSKKCTQGCISCLLVFTHTGDVSSWTTNRTIYVTGTSLWVYYPPSSTATFQYLPFPACEWDY